FMVSAFPVVASGKEILFPIWDLPQLSGHLNAQIEENWFSRGSAFWGYGLWFLNVIVHFFTLLLLNTLLGEFLARSVGKFKGNRWKTFGPGLAYLIGIPVLIVYCLATMLSIPFGLLLLATYLISIWLGDCLAALLLCHLLNSRNERSWSYWTIVLLSLGIVITIDLLVFFPVLGILIYIVILAFTYGVFFNLVKQTYPNINLLNK
ncbi:MAG: hypothetical protein HKP60_09210, partial [Eudoraea sp.]|nr:hypothetical protein [Eudoraea sp.]NNJ41033.1 hypothetical protein [Eudoraea sp.]